MNGLRITFSKEVLGNTHIWECLYPDQAYHDMIVTRAHDLLIGKATLEDWETQIVCKNVWKKILSVPIKNY